MSGVASNGDAAGQAREYNSIRTAEIGDDYGVEGFKWSGGALAVDGCIYCTPLNADRILRINPKTSTTALVGKSLGIRGDRYEGAAPSKDGRFVYFIPRGRLRVLKFDIGGQNWTEIGDNLGQDSWGDPVLAADDCIYAAPYNGNTVLKIDTSDDSVERLEFDMDGSYGERLYSVSVLSRDKKDIFFIPFNAQQIFRFNVITKESKLLEGEYDGDMKWMSGVLHDDGCVYALPFNHNKILKYNPSDNTTELVGEDLDGGHNCQGGYKWRGGFMGNDGCIYGIPAHSGKLLRFDPGTAKSSFVGKQYEGPEKWIGCVQANDGNIFAIPGCYRRALKISLLGANESAAVYGINDGIDTPDLLGYDLYAQTLANHAKSLYNSAEPLCVGLLAPWGTGKSFFWQLIRKEFDRDQDKTKDRPKIDPLPRDPFMIVVWLVDVMFHYLGNFLQPIKNCAKSIREKIKENELFCCLFCCPFFVCFTLIFPVVFRTMSVMWRKVSVVLRALLPLIILPLWFAFGIIVSITQALFYTLKLIPTVIRLGWQVLKLEARGYIKADSSSQLTNNGSGLKDLEQGDTAGPKYIFVEFGAWTYRGTDNIWASLMEEMWSSVESKMPKDDVKWQRAGCKKADEEPSKYKNGEEAEQDMRRRYDLWKSIANLFILILVVASIYFAASSSTARNEISTWAKNLCFPGIFCPADDIETSSSSAAASSPTATPKELPDSLSAWLMSFFFTIIPASIAGIKASKVKKYVKSGFEAIDEQMKKHDPKTFIAKFARKDFSNYKGFMGEVQKEVKFLISYLRERNTRLVIFVDDLDRCDQEITMQILWAVKLLISDGPISCWLAIDTKIVVDYIEADFRTPISGYQYLEKIINLPFSIPALDEHSKVPFIEGVLDAPELNTDQVYNKLCHFKDSGEYEILGELNSSLTETDGKLNELVILAIKINAQVSGDMKFGQDELDITKLKDSSKLSQNFYSKLLQVARTNLVSSYKNFYNLLEMEEGWIYDVLKDRNGDAIKLPSPKVREDFKTLKSKAILQIGLHDFILKINTISHNSPMPVLSNLFGLAVMANWVFHKMNNAVQDAKGSSEPTSEVFQKDFFGGEEDRDSTDDGGRTTSPVSSNGSGNGNRDSGDNSGNGENEVSGVTSPAPAKIGYTNSSMVDSKEREFILEYAGFLSDVPRKIKRAVNVYSVTRTITINTIGHTSSFPEEDEDILEEKLFMLTLLQESFPYRTSWLVLMAICASGNDECEENTSGWETFHLLLQNLAKRLNVDGKREGKTLETLLGDLPLNDVYDRIVFGMLHSLPNSDKLLRADTHTQHFKPLLRGLKLKDLYSDVSKGGLQKFLFNLPQGMLNDVKSYRDHCVPTVISNFDVEESNEHEPLLKRWTAAPRRYSTLSTASN